MADTALITGGSGGIGAAMACAFARRENDVCVVGRDEPRLRAACERVTASGRQAWACQVELHDEDSCREVYQFARREAGPVRWLVHAAGQLARGPLSKLEPAEIHQAVFANLTAAIRLSQLFADELAEQRGGVLFVASTAGRVPWPYLSLYAGTKHGLIGFAEALRFEFEPRGIHVSVAYPPMTATAMTDPLASQGPGWFRRADPQRVGDYLVDRFLRHKRTIYYSWLDRLLCAGAGTLPAGLLRALLRIGRPFLARITAR